MASYVLAAVMGEVDFSSLSEAAWFGLPFSRETSVLAVFDDVDSTFLLSSIISIVPVLNEHKYIVPGLGDAGDLMYGDKI